MAAKMMSLKEVIVARVEAQGKPVNAETTKQAGKAIRATLRKHDTATLEANGFKGLTEHKQSYNGSRWPAMPASFARKLIDGKPLVKKND